jgi:hypothetical protein
MSKDHVLLDKRVTCHDDPSTDQLGFVHTQVIPDWFLKQLRDEKLDSLHTPTGNFDRMACIPVVVADQLLREFKHDINLEPIQKTLSLLRRLGLDVFITSNKAL